MRQIFAAVSLLGLVACRSAQNPQAVMVERPAHTGEVQVVTGAVPEDFQQIAVIHVSGTGPEAELRSLIDGLKREAGELGCNALVQVKVDRSRPQATATGVAGIVQ